MNTPIDELDRKITELFDLARTKNPVEFVHTLVRVDAITGPPDPLQESSKEFQAASVRPSHETAREEYEALVRLPGCLPLLANLLRCATEQSYRLFPFDQVPEDLDKLANSITADAERSLPTISLYKCRLS